MTVFRAGSRDLLDGAGFGVAVLQSTTLGLTPHIQALAILRRELPIAKEDGGRTHGRTSLTTVTNPRATRSEISRGATTPPICAFTFEPGNSGAGISTNKAVPAALVA